MTSKAHTSALAYARSLAFRGFQVVTAHTGGTYTVEGVKGHRNMRRVYRDERAS